MVLQSSGTISINDLVTEFGGSAPHSLSEYYRGGGLVPDTATNANIPTSGQIDMNDFYGGDVISGPATGALYTMGIHCTYDSKFGGFVGHDLLQQGYYRNAGAGPVVTSDAENVETVMQQVSDTSTDWKYISYYSTLNGLGVKSNDTVWVVARQNIADTSTSDNIVTPYETLVGGPGQYGYRGKPFQIFSNNVEKASMTTMGVSTIRTDGRGWTSGANFVYGAASGWLGTNDPSTTTTTSPIQLSGSATNWKTLGMGAGTRTDGKLWTWGANGSGITSVGGLLGVGSSNFSLAYSVPTQLGTATNWDRVQAEFIRNFASKTDGKLWHWGFNTSQYYGGSAPPGTISQAHSPTTPTEVAVGGTWDYFDGLHAVKTDGRLWTFSAENTAQSVGGVTHSTPVQVIGGGTTWDFPNWDEFMHGGWNVYPAPTWMKTDGRAWSITHQSWAQSDGSTKYMDPTGTTYTAAPTFTPRQLQGSRTDWVQVFHTGYAWLGIR
jgi:hypothetical protein